MAIAFRHRDDPAPELSAAHGLSVECELDAARMAALQHKPVGEILRRFAEGHRVYIARYAEIPAAWGWVATDSAKIGELGSTLMIPRGERYLWNFVTLEAYRGRGIYPRLLDAIVRRESGEAARFWIAYAPENRASEAGIRKAGFVPVAELSFDAAGQPAVRATAARGAEAAAILGLPQATEALQPCWRCARRAQHAGSGCATDQCCCDYQRADSGCAA